MSCDMELIRVGVDADGMEFTREVLEKAAAALMSIKHAIMDGAHG